ncbi:hypothetical protein HaLaN_15731 [Haematococcus lacustris]|uniref:Uncharacterized protein n=1 Tax=Haematococcus lacustris TaxID=44745 RepID=A0A699Z887_HAELA|nr:hypothetical protein HaLaN_15731 [Haematococcus lacustris]
MAGCNGGAVIVLQQSERQMVDGTGCQTRRANATGHPRHWLHPHGSRDNFLTHFCTDEAADLCDELVDGIVGWERNRDCGLSLKTGSVHMLQPFLGCTRVPDYWCLWRRRANATRIAPMDAC